MCGARGFQPTEAVSPSGADLCFLCREDVLAERACHQVVDGVNN